MKSAEYAADPGSSDERNYTIQSFARAESISIPTVYREISAGRLVAIKIGRLTRITPEDRAAWKARLRRVGGSSA